jgi:hypothetical protein
MAVPAAMNGQNIGVTPFWWINPVSQDVKKPPIVMTEGYCDGNATVKLQPYRWDIASEVPCRVMIDGEAKSDALYRLYRTQAAGDKKPTNLLN